MDATPEQSNIPTVQRVAAVLWPSFVLAGMATVVFFTFFDPFQMLACAGEAPLSRTGAYSVGFFMFWLLAAASSVTTVYYLRPCALINAHPQAR